MMDIETIHSAFKSLPADYKPGVRVAAAEAIDQIKKHGWVQHAFKTDNGICTVQGMFEAKAVNPFLLDVASGDFNGQKAIQIFQNCCIQYNDMQHRSEEDILLL